MNKSALRQHFLGQRRSLSAEEVLRRSLAISERFLMENFLSGGPTLPVCRVVHTFLPIARQNEVDTWSIIHRIWQDLPDVQIAVSVTDTTTNRRLSHHILTPETHLIENRWGIPEPQPDGRIAIDSGQIDLVLTPLLVFDRQGHRVGYGKGYYDRFLGGCRPDCQKIGLSLFEPIERIDDIEPTDVRLDACVIPDQVFHFNRF